MDKRPVGAGRILGFRVDVHYSWFVILATVTWLLASGYLALVGETLPFATRLLWSAGATLVFFASVVAHEVAHAMIARHYGIQVEAIELFALGGATRIDRELALPRQELLMAAAGPVTSMALAVLFGAWAWRGTMLGATGDALAQWVAEGNLCLAAFNLLPGFPLDGGRILRAILWQALEKGRATRIAVYSGRVLGIGMVLLGLWQVQGHEWLGAIMLAFAGWFVDAAADDSLKQLSLLEELQGHTVRDGMVTNCPRVPPGLTLDVLVSQLGRRSEPYCYPVMSDSILLGMVSSQDIEGIPQEYWPVTRAAEAMKVLDESRCVRPEQDLVAVLDLMCDPDVDRLAVMDGREFLGLITRDHLRSFPVRGGAPA